MSMLHISGKNNSSLTHVQPQDVQPNAVDVRLNKIFRVNRALFEISEEHKLHRGAEEVFPDHNDYFMLPVGVYEIIMENIVNIGEGEAGWVITRSTLNRNGLFITSGLYDSGYHGVIAGALHVTGGAAYIAKGTRVGQFLLFKSESLHKYDGDYGIGKAHDKYVYGETV